MRYRRRSTNRRMRRTGRGRRVMRLRRRTMIIGQRF